MLSSAVILCPLSVTDGWVMLEEQALPFDVFLTTYDIALIDQDFLSQIPCHYAVINEAQRLKHPSSVVFVRWEVVAFQQSITRATCFSAWINKSGLTSVTGTKPATLQPMSGKQRRCWSWELHRRFVNAIQQLGGSPSICFSAKIYYPNINFDHEPLNLRKDVKELNIPLNHGSLRICIPEPFASGITIKVLPCFLIIRWQWTCLKK
ncbi:probable helicase CHR10 isoform X1 [Tanacetum coccineum]